MKFYFVTTDHLETKIWFRDEEDFRVGMNYVAVTAAALKIDVIAFILMSNHVHFFLMCWNIKEARKFIDYFKKLYSSYCRKKYGEVRFLRRNDVDIREIDLENEGFERVVAYILMNSVAAKICLTPSGYRWSSGSCYFNDKKESGKPISSFSARAVSRLVHSETALPGDWIIGSEGYVLPESYVRIDIVEKVFKTPARMLYHLNSSSKAKRNRNLEGVAFRDQILSGSLEDLCQSIFKKKTFGDLSNDEKAEALKQLRWRFGADVHQISRVSGIPYEKVTEMLNKL